MSLLVCVGDIVVFVCFVFVTAGKCEGFVVVVLKSVFVYLKK